MKIKHALFAQIVVLGITSCTSNNSETELQKERDQLRAKNIELTKTTESLQNENQELSKTIDLLKYPAPDRLVKIKNLISENKFSEANTEMERLSELFSESKEATEIGSLKELILEKQKKVEEEQQRIKSLGFKALREENSVEVGYNKISIGAFSTSKTFVFDSYDGSYHFRTADRGHKYISSKISIHSSNNAPLLPVFYAYSIDGSNLRLINSLNLRFAKWEDYATYLGNYSDNGNDFAKTSTIGFKIGIELSDEVLRKPIVILLRKDNCASRQTNRFAEPPVSYSIDGCHVPSTLSMDDVKIGYAVIKIFNKDKI